MQTERETGGVVAAVGDEDRHRDAEVADDGLELGLGAAGDGPAQVLRGAVAEVLDDEGTGEPRRPEDDGRLDIFFFGKIGIFFWR